MWKKDGCVCVCYGSSHYYIRGHASTPNSQDMACKGQPGSNKRPWIVSSIRLVFCFLSSAFPDPSLVASIVAAKLAAMLDREEGREKHGA
jgi:hypothetical protein